MKTLIIYKSVHHGNTEKVAKVMAKMLNAQLLEADKADARAVIKYDLIGFGSGIYAFRHHPSILELADKLPTMEKKAFIFSTAGWPAKLWHRALRKRLEKKEVKLIGEFCCKGYDTFGPLKLIGGTNKGRPNKEDLKKAEEFAKSLE